MRIGIITAMALCGALAAGCGEADADDAGIVAQAEADDDSSAAALDYVVTSETYRKWMAAEQRLAAIGVPELSARIPLAATDDERREAVEAMLEEEPRVREAIEGSDLSVEDYVATTIALDQATAPALAGGRAAYRGLPAANVEVVTRNGDEIRRTRRDSRVRTARRVERREERREERRPRRGRDSDGDSGA